MDKTKPKARHNYYEILNVGKDATRKEIVEAYQKAKSTYEKNSMALYSLYSDDDSENMMNLIEEAYQVLINPQRRNLYNREYSISTTRSVVNIVFDKPGEIKRTFVETPDFKNVNSKDVKTESKANTKINKVAFKAYASTLSKEEKFENPEYNIDEEMEEQIKKEHFFSGDFFARVRIYKNMSFSYVSNKLKLAVYHIEAIEREDFKALPVRVYTRGFISSYAKLLGLNQDLAVSAYMERYDKFSLGI
jgi:curved DNA-binding protein CbpA